MCQQAKMKMTEYHTIVMSITRSLYQERYLDDNTEMFETNLGWC